MNETNSTTEFKTEPNIGDRILAGIVDYIIIYGFTFFLIFTIGEPTISKGAV